MFKFKGIRQLFIVTDVVELMDIFQLPLFENPSTYWGLDLPLSSAGTRKRGETTVVGLLTVVDLLLHSGS